MARRKALKGKARVKRLFKALPEAMHGQIETVLDTGGRHLQTAMKAKAPFKTGATRAGIAYKVLPRTLRLRVGLLGTPTGRAKLFYARIQDLGRIGRTVTVRRFRAGAKREYTRAGYKTGPNLLTYKLRVRPMEGKRFVTGRYPELRTAIQRLLRGVWGRALEAIPGGGDE